MTEKRRDEAKVPDAWAVNPHYKGAKISDVARALLQPKATKADPEPQKAKEREVPDGDAHAD